MGKAQGERAGRTGVLSLWLPLGLHWRDPRWLCGAAVHLPAPVPPTSVCRRPCRTWWMAAARALPVMAAHTAGLPCPLAAPQVKQHLKGKKFGRAKGEQLQVLEVLGS